MIQLRGINSSQPKTYTANPDCVSIHYITSAGECLHQCFALLQHVYFDDFSYDRDVYSLVAVNGFARSISLKARFVEYC